MEASSCSRYHLNEEDLKWKKGSILGLIYTWIKAGENSTSKKYKLVLKKAMTMELV